MCARTTRAAPTLATALAAAALLCACSRAEPVVREDGLAALGWDAPDVHFVYAAGARDDGASAPGSAAPAPFVPATAAEWRGYTLWAAARGHAGVDEALVRAQQGTFWHAAAVPLRDAAGRAYRCYLEQRRARHNSPAGAKNTASAGNTAGAGANDNGGGGGAAAGAGEPRADPAVVDAYFRARDYRAAAALVAGACLRTRAGAYTYELCPGRGARQQRLAADTGAVLEEYRLGRPSARDNARHDRDAHARARAAASLAWIAAGRELAATHVTRFEHDRAGRRFVQHYSGGDECWATKLPRAAEVVYTCDPARAQPALTAVAEVAPCQYRLHVASPALCRHPFFAHAFGLPGSAADGPSSVQQGQQQEQQGQQEGSARQLVLCVADRRPQDVPEGTTLLFEQPDRATVLAYAAEQQRAAAQAARERQERAKLEELVRQGLVGSFTPGSSTPQQQQQQKQAEDGDSGKTAAEKSDDTKDKEVAESDNDEEEDEDEDDEDDAIFGF